jgi:hypothetical protein
VAAANIYSIDSPPDFEFIVNNQEGRDIRCLNYVFRLKTSGKKSWNYLCTSKNYTASLSLKAFSFGEQTKLSEPHTLIALNLKHKDNCQPKLDDFFTQKQFLQDVKVKVKENPLVPIQQLYETQRAEERKVSQVTMPDYDTVKGRFKRERAKESRPVANCLANVVVHDVKTKDGQFNFIK